MTELAYITEFTCQCQ